MENAPEMQKYPKTLVHVNNASNVSSFAMELDEFLVNYQITASCQTNVSQALYQKKQTIKLTLKSCFSKPTIAIGFNCNCNRFKFVDPCLVLYLYGALFTLSFHVLIFFGDGSHFHDTAPLIPPANSS